jgi:flavin reductase (DIM6/NTAB) family NADH-FMN oxidoreductase RutF
MVPASLAVEADYCGIRSGRSEDKPATAGLTLEAAELVSVPLLAESPLNVECRFVRELELGEYRLVLGEILQIHAVDSAFRETGGIDTKAFDPLVYLGGIREYWDLGSKQADAYSAGKQLIDK